MLYYYVGPIRMSPFFDDRVSTYRCSHQNSCFSPPRFIPGHVTVKVVEWRRWPVGVLPWVCACLSARTWDDTLTYPAGCCDPGFMLAPPAVHCCSADGHGPGLISGNANVSAIKINHQTWQVNKMRYNFHHILLKIVHLQMSTAAHCVSTAFQRGSSWFLFLFVFYLVFLLYFEIKTRADFRPGPTYSPPTWHSSWQTTRRTSSPCPVCADSVP